jgi:hypothetical protein
VTALATTPRPREASDPLSGSRAGERSLLPHRLFEPGGTTLEERISDVWDELLGAGRTECPVCSANMVAASGCAGCGSELS